MEGVRLGHTHKCKGQRTHSGVSSLLLWLPGIKLRSSRFCTKTFFFFFCQLSHLSDPSPSLAHTPGSLESPPWPAYRYFVFLSLGADYLTMTCRKVILTQPWWVNDVSVQERILCPLSPPNTGLMVLLTRVNSSWEEDLGNARLKRKGMLVSLGHW